MSDCLSNIIFKLTKGNVLGPSRFSTYMLENLDEWEDITYEEIKKIVDLIKYNGSTYSFFPFCYLFLEIDLFRYYEEMSRSSSFWNKEKSEIQIKSFKVYPLNKKEKLIKLKLYESLKYRLTIVKKRLIKEGAYPVKNDTVLK